MAITFLPQARAVLGDQTLNFAPLNAGLDSVIQGNRQNALMRQNQEQFDARQGLQREQMNQNALLADRRMAMAEAQAKRDAAMDPYKMRVLQAQAAQAEMQGRASQQRQQMLQSLFAPAQQSPAAPTPAMPQQPPSGAGRFAQPAMAPQAPATQGGGGPAWFERLSPTQKDAARIAAANGDWSAVSEIVAASGRPSLTPAQEATDKKFAAEYAQFTSGGFADMQKNLGQIRDVIQELKTGQAETGPVTGALISNDVTGSVFAPQSLDAKQRVEEVVQRNLREVLGAQFTQKEGDRLIARAYNPSLKKEQNIARLNRLVKSMEDAMKAKESMARYFEQNGTLKGFRGKTSFTIDDISQRAGLGKVSESQKRYKYNPETGELE